MSNLRLESWPDYWAIDALVIWPMHIISGAGHLVCAAYIVAAAVVAFNQEYLNYQVVG